MIAPAGLYASDRDMFVFMVNERNPIEDGRGNRLSRGFFCWNSEVGDKSFGLMMFLYAHVCGNHIVWGADDVREVRIRHVGSANRRAWWEFRRTLSEAVECSAEEEEGRIRAAQSYRIAATKYELLDTIFKFRWNTVSRKTLELAYQVRPDGVGLARAVQRPRLVPRRAHLKGSNEKAIRETDRAQMSGMQWHRISDGNAAGKAWPQDLPDSVQELRW
jgi:hypothetical protein